MRGSTWLAIVLIILFIIAVVVVIGAVINLLNQDLVGESFSTSDSPWQVEWVPINPPPGVEGPCYAYFQRESSGYQGYGYSGVYCK